MNRDAGAAPPAGRSIPATGRTVAVVDVGSSAVRVIVAEVHADGTWKRLDRAQRPIALGRDVFTTGLIGREAMLQAIDILLGFSEMLDGWNIDPRHIRVIATSAIREARNRDTFIDRVFIRTGMRINVIEGVEENHLTYVAVQNAINQLRPQFSRSGALILEVGGGTSELMILNRGKMVSAHSLRIGTVRIQQQVHPGWDTGEQIENYLRENVRVTKEVLESEFDLNKVRFFVAVGGDARVAAAHAGERREESYSTIDRAAFDAFITGLQDQSVDECVADLGITYHEAEALIPALLVYKFFLEVTAAEYLIVPDVSIREGVIMTFALGSSRMVETQFYSQVIESALSLGRKYHFDEPHARHVAKLALALFDQLDGEHGLDNHARLLLEVACLLHDVGNYIRSSGHHKHSQYIVANSEIFGFSREDIRIISNLVRYHRKATPQASHPHYAGMRREHRLTVLKLASLLRIADALDRSHSQRVESIATEIVDADLLLHCTYSGDITVERFGVQLKGDMMADVFGYTVKLI